MPYIINPPTNITIETSKSNRATGEELWSKLNVKEKLKPTREILDIVIESDNPQTLQLPWELLYHPTYGFLAQHPNFTLSRKIPNLSNRLTPLEKRPLRVLFFSTLPDDIGEEGRLSVEREQEVVLETLLPFRQEGLVEITVPNDGRFETLKKLIEKEKPDMVFLSGHSSYANGKGYFLFEDRRGLGIHIDEDELNSAFVGSSVECVVLSSCQSAMADDKMLESGLVRSLAFYGIKNVIGMRESIYDEAGVVFAKHFLEQVAKKKSIAFAVQKARDEIHKLENFAQEHWHLPILISQDINRPLVDWDFDPKAPSFERLNQKLNQILYPNLYIGRRKEFRRFYNYLYSNSLKKLLLYGEGGIGKTAMVAKFGLELREEGYKVFDYSLKHGGDFDDFLLDIELELNEANSRKFALIKERCSDEVCIVQRLTKLLLSEHKKVAFIFDNLEDIQDPTTKELTDEKLKIWIETLSSVDNVVVLMTSRWKLPNCEHSIAVNRPLKSDFLYFVATQNIKFSRPDKLEKVFETLGGNYRGVELFIRAIEGMNSLDEEQFLAKLSTATREIQIDMSIEQILSYLSKEERELLEQITVYDVPIPQEGVRKVALDLPKEALGRLVSFSLIEESYNAVYEVNEYQISALVLDYLKEKDFTLKEESRVLASEYLFWLFKEERKIFTWGWIAYEALKRVDSIEVFEEWLFDETNQKDIKLQGSLLNGISVQNINFSNYAKALEYLEQSLKIYGEMGDKWGEGTTLNNISEIHYKRGNLIKALEYLELSLKIYVEIGDKRGEGLTLSNISKSYIARGDLSKALEYLTKSWTISIEIGDKFIEGRILNMIFDIHYNQGNLTKALECLEKSLNIHVTIGDKLGEGAILSNISQIYHAQEDLTKALEYLEESLKICVEIGNKSGEGETLNNIAMVYKDRGDLIKALEYLEKSLKIRIEIDDKFGKGRTLNNIAMVYKDREDLIKALEYLEKSLKIEVEIGNKLGECVSRFNLGHIYFANDEVNKALIEWFMVYKIAKKIENIRVLNALDGLAKQLKFENFEALREKIIKDIKEKKWKK